MSDISYALVTGALGGLGTAIVKRIVGDGGHVIATDRRDEDADAWLAGFSADERERIRVRSLDVTQEEQVTELREALDASGIHVRYLVNNAGVAGAGVPWTMAAKTFDIIMRVNLYGTFYCTRAFIEPMVKARFGRIVNFASLYAYDPGPGQAPYAAAKAGIVGYSHSTAKDVGKHGVTINVIAPGLIWHERLKGVLPDEEYEQMKMRAPMQRMGEPREIAGTVAFLLSADSSFITGQTIHVNGGAYLTG